MPPLQTSYGFMSAAREGEIAEWAQNQTLISRSVEGASIPFGKAVLQGVNDYGVKLPDGSGNPFRGVTVRNQSMAAGTLTIGQWPAGDDCMLMTKGVIWVMAAGIVSAGQPAFITPAGGFGSSAESIAANGNIAFTSNPSAGQTLTLNGSAITFVAASPTGNQVLIGANPNATVANLLAFLQASTDTQIVKFAGSLDSTGLILNLLATTTGTGGNALTLATTVTGATPSGATLTGGGSASIVIPNANFDTSATAAAQLVKLRLN